MFRFINNVKNSEFGKRIKEKLYPGYLVPEFKKAMERYRVCDTIKKKPQIKKEIRLYKKFWGCYPYDYFLCDLYRADNQITQEEIINYIPAFFWYELYLPHHTSYNYSQIIDNKILTEQIFRSLKIPQADTFCLVINNKLYSSEMVKSTFDQILHDIKQNNPDKIFVKPAESCAGRGIYIFNKTDSGLYATREKIIFNDNFLSMISRDKNYIVQPGVLQNQDISKIFPGSVNTCRIITENKEGVSRVVCAVLRIGRGQSDIDNASAGGIFLKIDINSGKVGEQAMSYELEKYSEHPDTHFVFHNSKIPRWNEIRKFAVESADKFPLFAHLGWDIALTMNGPIAIETNLSPGIEVHQIPSGGLRQEFSITDPNYYWKTLGKRL